jgi:outer membrane immunogenic protein
MVRLLSSAAAIAFLAGAAMAADLPIPAEPIPAAPILAAYNWSGFYVGANGGFAFDGENDWEGVAVTNDLEGWFAGGTVGFNWQANPWLVFGVEGDWDWADINGSDPCPNPAFTCSTDVEWLATARGRVGIAWDRFMVYGTGGGAFAGVLVEANPQIGGGSSDETYFGWTAGGGVEIGLWNSVSVKGEYAFVDLGDEDAVFAGVPLTFNPEFQAVKFGVNYRFSWLAGP